MNVWRRKKRKKRRGRRKRSNDHRSESEKVICLWMMQLLFSGRREKFGC